MKISAKQYAHAIFELTDNENKKKIDPVIGKFVAQIKKNGHMKLSQEIIIQFKKIYDKTHNIVSATITTAFPLNTTQKKSVENFIAQEYDATGVTTTYCEDPNVKGGIVIRVGEEIIDASVDRRMKMINDALLRS
jgi:F-type H+-transporting ATPase subunit delta